MGKYIVGVCEGGELLCREAPLPRAPPRRDGVGERLGGEAASLREAPLPPDPSLPKSGWRLTWGLLHRWFRLRVGAFVTCWRWGNEPLRPPMAGTSPFRGGFASGKSFAATERYIFHPLPRMVPLLLWKEARGGGIAATSKCFVPFRHDQRALRSPFGNLRPIIPQTMWYPTLAGRGGSVSRRDHNHPTRNRAQLAWARKLGRKVKPIPNYSSGEGVWGRGASLREAASPPESALAIIHFPIAHAWLCAWSWSM